ncbi:MAG TPA: L-rhamnose mutarotase [Chitinophagaceae bacterium]|jgi:L-rhamnose mutarotase|nr:L-rhamnose mutarotase [Chitinophagaceae bacterium]
MNKPNILLKGLVFSVGITKGTEQEGENMQRVSFKMKLFAGQAAEYKKRHDEIWPELKSLLITTGIEDYSIFLDEETNTLFGVLKVGDETNLDKLPAHPLMQKWWAYMKDIMETNEDNSPVSTRLREVFYLS